MGSLKLTPIKVIVLILIFLNCLSLLSLYSGLHQDGEFAHRSIFYKQLVWILISWAVLIACSFLRYRLYLDLSFIFYGLNILLLLAVIFFGRTVMGAQRWINILGINFQPSEFSKITAIIILARCFSQPPSGRFLKDILFPLGLISFNAALILLQPDLGTALTLIVIFLIMAFSSRVNKLSLFILIIFGAALTPFGWHFLKDYQKKRLMVFVNPNADPLGAGYSIIQSKLAIGSGRLTGKGFLSGTQNQFNFLPERHTDFIFTIIAEEWGFLGSLFLILIYWLILRKILDKTKQLTDPFAQQLTYGIAAFYFLHVFINLGMTLGILPVVGIPLTFISYGGTHMLVSFLLMGIFFNICRSYK